jgi:hypothetical protein
MADAKRGSDMPEQLQDYWTHGEGAAKIAWGSEGDFDRCRRALRGKVPGRMIDGACNRLHKRATGKYPAEGH